MSSDSWEWKAKSGGNGGLLYEPGNWGDMLKILWLSALLDWRAEVVGMRENTSYFDPFAGDVTYPLTLDALKRFNRVCGSRLDFIREPFLEHGVWPSSASAARLLVGGGICVFDADAGRRKAWTEGCGECVLSGESGWTIAAEREADSCEIRLLDPYDFMADWRDQLASIVEKSAVSTTLVYIYTRSAGKPEAFREYRAFRNALGDLCGGRPHHIGRVAADGFLPRAHHEMLFLPGKLDAESAGYARLREVLETRARDLADAINASGTFV